MSDSPSRLKLRARDDADLAVLSALVQDSLVPRHQMSYVPHERRFVMLANRFRWEAGVDSPPPPVEEGEDASFEQDAAKLAADLPEAGDSGPLYSRIIAGLCFDRVRAVRTRGLPSSSEDTPMSLLAISRGRAAWLLTFAEGAEIRLEGRAIVAHLEDLGEAWPTRWRPAHSVAEAD